MTETYLLLAPAEDPAAFLGSFQDHVEIITSDDAAPRNAGYFVRFHKRD